jgi:hypothetical protein
VFCVVNQENVFSFLRNFRKYLIVTVIEMSVTVHTGDVRRGRGVRHKCN